MKATAVLISGAGLFFALGVGAFPGQDSHVRILRPSDKVVLTSPEVEIAVIVPRNAELPAIRVDGETLGVPALATDLAAKNSESNTQPMFFPPALIFVRPFSPGLHRITAGKHPSSFSSKTLMEAATFPTIGRVTHLTRQGIRTVSPASPATN